MILELRRFLQNATISVGVFGAFCRCLEKTHKSIGNFVCEQHYQNAEELVKIISTSEEREIAYGKE